MCHDNLWPSTQTEQKGMDDGGLDYVAPEGYPLRKASTI